MVTAKKKFLLRLTWLVLVPALLMELGLRLSPREPGLYATLEDHLSEGSRSIVFIGSSRTTAAIDAPLATKALRESGYPKTTVYNLGIPYSTQAEHALAIRNLIDAHPGQLRGSLWLMEAPMGVPDRQIWHDPWFHPDYKEFLLRVMRTSELPRLWRSAGTRFYDKVYISVAHFSLFGQWVFETRLRMLVVGEHLMEKILPAPSHAAPTTDLVAEAGIRTDEAGVRFARELAIRNSEQGSSEAGLASSYSREWSQTIVSDMIHDIEAAGGRLVFLEMPLSSVQAKPYRAISEEKKRDLPAPIVRTTDFKFTDEDFPDLWHLRKSRRAEFTSLLMPALKKLLE